MLKAKNGALYEYENFRQGRVFIYDNGCSVTIKACQTYRGKLAEVKAWLCVSSLSKKPVVYSFVRGGSIRNVTYQSLDRNLDWLLNKVSANKNQVRQKRENLKRKFVNLVSERSYGKKLNFTDFIGETIKSWFPLLSVYSNEEVVLIEDLKLPLIRRGLKKDSWEKASKVWFRSPSLALTQKVKGLLLDRRVESRKRFAQLTLLLACRGWELNSLNKLCDLNVKCYFSLDFQKARFLFGQYNPRLWLSLFIRYNLDKNFLDFICLSLAVDGFAALNYQASLLPENPNSIVEIYMALPNLTEQQKSDYCLCELPPIPFMLDCPQCGRPYEEEGF